jgi:hypothetical protein
MISQALNQVRRRFEAFARPLAAFDKVSYVNSIRTLRTFIKTIAMVVFQVEILEHGIYL